MLNVIEKLSKRIDDELFCHIEIMSDLGWFQQCGDESLNDVVSREKGAG